MTYEIAIVAHNDRRDAAHKLMGDTKAVHMEMDDGRHGAGANHLRVWDWMHYRCAADWVVVLEDDALPCEGFRNQLEMALAVAPTPLVSLYLGRGRPPQHQDMIAQAVVQFGDPCWLTSPHLFHHVGVALRRQYVEHMTERVASLSRQYPIDEAIGRWAQERKIQVSYTNPSLVDHHWEQPTVIKYRALNGEEDLVEREIDYKRPRKAWRFGPRTEWNVTRLPIGEPVELAKDHYIPF